MRAGTVRVVAVVAAAAVSLFAASCSDDEGTAEVTASSVSSTTADPAPERTTSTLADDEFTEVADGFVARVEQAGTDLCAVVEAGTFEFETDAVNPAQVEQTIRMQVTVMERLAATTPVDDANAQLLDRSRERLQDAAAAAEYAPEFLTSDEYADVLMGEDFQTALNSYFARAQTECGLEVENGQTEG